MKLKFYDLCVFSSKWEETKVEKEKEIVSFGFEAGSGSIKFSYHVDNIYKPAKDDKESLLRPYATQKINVFIIKGYNLEERYEPIVLKSYTIDVHNIIHMYFVLPNCVGGDAFDLHCSVDALTKEELKEIKTGDKYSIKINYTEPDSDE